ncbi:hypothetical protein COOONC_14332 [Cooperia oncophora]
MLPKKDILMRCHLREYFQPGDRIPWFFSENNQLAGFAQRYSGQGGQGIGISIDVLTVKGAGHMVPNDRPGPSVQMITNFMFPGSTGVNYTSKAHTNPQPDVSPMKAASALTLLSVIMSLVVTNQ